MSEAQGIPIAAQNCTGTLSFLFFDILPCLMIFGREHLRSPDSKNPRVTRTKGFLPWYHLVSAGTQPAALGETITSLTRLRLSDNSVQRSNSQVTFNRGPVGACSRWPFSLIPGLVCLLFLFVVFGYSIARRPWRDSNAQPLPPQGSALSIELQGLVAGR